MKNIKILEKQFGVKQVILTWLDLEEMKVYTRVFSIIKLIDRTGFEE